MLRNYFFMADITISPANVIPSTASTTIHLQPPTTIAGEIIAAGETVCLLAADGFYWKADANDTDKQDVQGIAGSSAAAAGQRLDVISETPSLEVGAHGQAIATPLFQSATPGKLCPLADLTTGAVPVLVAYVATATALQIILAQSGVAKP